ncbi:hypothetical protein NSP_5860 [Nodularia spumigena CCY9414]|nr:hypothetical protein NSP_5860 [Nodularia spumigena CCY9414]
MSNLGSRQGQFSRRVPLQPGIQAHHQLKLVCQSLPSP